MSRIPSLPLTGALPAGYRAVPVEQDDASSLRIAVLFGESVESASPLVLLRDELDTRSYLACLVDRSGRVQQWLELRVQCIAGWLDSLEPYRGKVNNLLLDERFEAAATASRQTISQAGPATGWEREWDRPLFFVRASGEPVDLGEDWHLCRDDAKLEAAGLPPFSASLHRYLADKKGATFVPVTPGAPENSATVTNQVAEDPEMVALNPEGGRMSVHPWYPLSLEDYLRVLNGESWEGMPHGRNLLDPGELAEGLGSDALSGRLYLGAQGGAGRLLETLALKLQLLAQAIRAVARQVASERQPLYTLSGDSFRVGFEARQEYVPYLWNAQCLLVKPGDAISLPIQSTGDRYYVSASPPRLNIYRSKHAGQPTSGKATIRIRELDLQGKGGAAVLGTFQTTTEIQATNRDLFWFRINVVDARIDFFARLEMEAVSASGEWPFQTLGKPMDPAMVEALQSAAGVPLQDVPFELYPLCSTPCDLYSLAVLAARILVGDDPAKFPAAWDDLLGLARAAGEEAPSLAVLPQTMEKLLPSNPSWVRTLGPDHLCNLNLGCEEALKLLPPALWWEVLAMIACMIPGLHPLSTCAHYGDAPPTGLERVFDTVSKDVDTLIRKTRSCIIPDGTYNQEVQDVLELFKKNYR